MPALASQALLIPYLEEGGLALVGRGHMVGVSAGGVDVAGGVELAGAVLHHTGIPGGETMN